MTEERGGAEAEPKEQAADGVPEPKGSAPFSERADSRDETEGKPGSGQNEDG